ncbi:S8 family peptidase [Hahella sp. HN01]|nr:S8 family peptidase [Hahella sp. HN01]MBU6953580.1 S8 family peptidase [Hahella sp. HN01]
MKNHVRIKLRRPVAALEDLPHWQQLLGNRRLEHERFLPDVDRIFHRHRLSFFATREYQPAGPDWSEDEIASGLNRVYRLVLSRDGDIPPDMIAEIRLLPEVEEAAPGDIGQMELNPRSAAMSARTDRASREAIFLEEAQAFSQGDSDIVVAVLDTGVELDHPELRHAIRGGYDFVNILDGASEFIGDYIDADAIADDEVGHGTHVAGIIVGKGQGMPGGVAPRCKLIPVRVLAAMEKQGRRVGAGLIENINAGVKYAVDQGAHVINMSLGVRHEGGGLPHQEVIDYAYRKGVTIVAASGNDGLQEMYYPGAFETVIAVGAMDAQGQVADFSTYGDQVSFIAPGVDVYSAYLDNEYAFSTGTSHAAPFVTGAVALLKSYARKAGRTLSDGQIKHILKHTSDKIDNRFKHRKAGYGRLNLADAMRYLEFKLGQRRERYGYH